MSTLTILRSAGSDFLTFIDSVVSSYDSTVETATTYQLIDSVSGMKITVTGTGFTYDGSGNLTGGTVTDFLLEDGNNYASVTGFTADGATFGSTLLTGTWQDIMDQFGAMTFLGEIGPDAWQGSNFDDVASGGQGNDVLNGSGGNDIIEGGGGADTLDGGSGTDSLYYGHSGAAVTVDLSTNTVSGGDADGDTIVNFENVYGSAFDDVITGDSRGNYIEGQDGADTINGGGGDDTIVGDAGGDAMDGGDGVDWLDYRSSTLGVAIDLSTNTASGGDAEGDTIANFENVYGSLQNDTLTGDAGNNSIDAGAGDDVVSGGDGNDYILGGAGADTLSGGNGVDALSYRTSGSGVTVDIENNTASGGDAEGDVIDGFEDVYGSAQDDVITGNALNNRIDGGIGNDTISGGAGDDSITGGAGADVLDGGDGRDALIYRSAGASMTIDLSTNTVTGDIGNGDVISNFEDVYSGRFHDTLIGNALDNLLDSAGGNDTLSGGDGNDTLVAGAGADFLSGGAGIDFLDGGNGIDTADYSEKTQNVVVTLNGAVTATVTVAGIAEDSVRNIENLVGGLGNDQFTGDGNANVLTGNGGADLLKGGGGNDTLNGGDGADSLIGGAGADTMAGGTGNDSYFIDNAGDTTVEAVGQGYDFVYTTISYALGAGQEIERFETTNSAGTAAINLTGNEFNDFITGNNGNNILDGGAGNDRLSGLSGDDTYYVDSALDVVIEAVGRGNDTVITSVSWALGSSYEVENIQTSDATATTAINLTGNEFANTITGNAGDNLIKGGLGIDTMTGLGGNDIYIVDNAADVVNEAVGGGTDQVFTAVSYTLGAGQEIERLQTNSAGSTAAVNLIGNEFDNTITGNAGDNILNGRLGNDTLNGGAGMDTFRFNTALGTDNVDRIVSFSVADDTIQLSSTIFSALSAGALDAGAFNVGAAATQADDRIIYNTATGVLRYDADGVGGADGVQFAKLIGVSGVLSASDFTII